MFDPLKRLYYKITGYSYTNLGRLFIRLFVGLMLMQFGIRQLMQFDQSVLTFPEVFGMTPDTSLTVMIIIEIACSLFIMCGFLTRLMVLPPFISMVLAAKYLLYTQTSVPTYDLGWQQQGYLPIMFLGIYFFILLVGPGKISVDYFLSLYLIHSDNREEDEELEEV